jgi:hypothetical protein
MHGYNNVQHTGVGRTIVMFGTLLWRAEYTLPPRVVFWRDVLRAKSTTVLGETCGIPGESLAPDDPDTCMQICNTYKL